MATSRKATPRKPASLPGLPEGSGVEVGPMAWFNWPKEEQEKGWARCRDYINAAAGDYIVQRSPDARMLVALLSDLLYECTPDTWPEQFIERVAGPIGKLNAKKKERKTIEVAAEKKSADNRERVKQAWEKLLPVHQGSPAVAKISKATGLSKPTVRDHMVALGLRAEKKGK